MEKNSSSIQKRKLIIFVSCFLLLVICFLIWWAIYLPQNVLSNKEIIFNVEKGEGSREIAFNLKKEGLIKSKVLFRIHAFNKRVAAQLQAGTYLLSPRMNVPQIIDKLAKGDVLKEKITIIEGWNLRDIGRYFENRGMFQAEEFFELVGFPLVDYSKANGLSQSNDFSQEFNFLGDKSKHLGLEGYLFPDTYEFNKGVVLEEIVKKMLNNFDKKMTQELKEEIEAQEKSIFEIITMASLIEKEVQTQEDKKLVSGILWKRLKKGMPLQVDATIIYIVDKKTTKVSIEETKIDSPYNTYKYKGLPLGSICNPGLESIRAAIYPEISEYFYYLSTPEGETIFSKTLKEHNYAKSKYLR